VGFQQSLHTRRRPRRVVVRPAAAPPAVAQRDEPAFQGARYGVDSRKRPPGWSVRAASWTRSPRAEPGSGDSVLRARSNRTCSPRGGSGSRSVASAGSLGQIRPARWRGGRRGPSPTRYSPPAGAKGRAVRPRVRSRESAARRAARRDSAPRTAGRDSPRARPHAPSGRPRFAPVPRRHGVFLPRCRGRARADP